MKVILRRPNVCMAFFSYGLLTVTGSRDLEEENTALRISRHTRGKRNGKLFDCSLEGEVIRRVRVHAFAGVESLDEWPAVKVNIYFMIDLKTIMR